MSLRQAPATLAPLRAFVGRLARAAKLYRKVAELVQVPVVAKHFEVFAGDFDEHIVKLSDAITALGGPRRRDGFDTDPDLQDMHGDSAIVDRMITVERSIIEQARDLVGIARQDVELVTAIQRCASTALGHSTWLIQVRLKLLPAVDGWPTEADIGSPVSQLPEDPRDPSRIAWRIDRDRS